MIAREPRVGLPLAVPLLLVCSALTGCLVTPPGVQVQGAAGLVRAESVAQAEAVARLVDTLEPQVRVLVPDLRDGPVEVWVQSELALYDGWPVGRSVPAFTVESTGRIHLQEAGELELSAALAHELVHALLGPAWATLPPVAEEGLADWVQEHLHPRLAAAMRADHLAKAAAAMGGLRVGIWCPPGILDGGLLTSFTFMGPPAPEEPVDPRDALDGRKRAGRLWTPYDVSVSDPRMYGVGYLVVSRIVERGGLARLKALCEQAGTEGHRQVPADWLLAAAELERDAEQWHRVIAARIGPSELGHLGASMVPDLLDLLLNTVRPYLGSLSGGEFLRRYRPRLGVEHGEVRVHLAALPGLRAGVRRVWPAVGPRDA